MVILGMYAGVTRWPDVRVLPPVYSAVVAVRRSIGLAGASRWSEVNLLMAVGLAAASLSVGIADHGGGVVFGLATATGAATVARRWRSPMLACLVAVAGESVARAVAAHPGHVSSGVAAVASLLDFYALGYRTAGAGGRVRVCSAVLVGVPLGLLARWDPNGALDGLASWLFFVGFPLGAGWALATRSALARVLEEENACCEREQQHRIDWLARHERGRVARELHDIVGHTVSVMVIQAAGARSAAYRNPTAALQALETVERCGREGLNEMEQLIAMLRQRDHEGAGGRAAPSLAQVERLIESTRSADIPVSLEIRGRPHTLAPGVDLAAYRVVQEALTNTVKHAGPASAQVSITYSAAVLDVEVADNGAGSGLSLTAQPGGGTGLVGLRDRVQLYDGELAAGPRRDGRGFRVHARFPIEPEPLLR